MLDKGMAAATLAAALAICIHQGVPVHGKTLGRIMASDMYALSGDLVATPEGGKALSIPESDFNQFGVTAPSPGLYKAYARVSSLTGASLSLKGADSSLIRVPRTSSRQGYVTLTDYIQLDGGPQTVGFGVSGGEVGLAWIELAHCLPGTVEAEGYQATQGKGVRTSTLTDDNGALVLEKGGLARYVADIADEGTYRVDFRVRSAKGGELGLKADDSGATLQRVPVPASSGWSTVTAEMRFETGRNVLNVVAASGKVEVDSFRVHRPVEPLRIDGGRILGAGGNPVRLLGVNVASLEWSAMGERVLRSSAYACDNWKANIIRLPLSAGYWLDDADGYRDRIRRTVDLINDRGKYVVLDMHGYVLPTADEYKAWMEIAAAYSGNPGVLFGILNEPHDITWTQWKNGGTVKKDGNAYESPGIQAVVNGIRGTGANNVLVVGGNDWAYDLRGMTGKNAIEDPLKSIILDTHPYPWKSKPWDTHVTVVKDRYPVLVGEFGCDPIRDPAWVPNYPGGAPRYMADILGWMDKHGYNATAWCFHPEAGPILISDWSYDPSYYFGAYVRDWLYSKGSRNHAEGLAVETEGNRRTLDLGAVRSIRRWVLGYPGRDKAVPGPGKPFFTLQASTDGQRWVDIDTASPRAAEGDWEKAYIDRVVAPFRARYIRVLSKGMPDTGQDLGLGVWE